MKNYFLYFLSSFFFISCTQKQAGKIVLETGISFELATYRKQQISEVVYDIHLKIPKEKEEPIPARLEVFFRVHDLKNDVFLDFNEQTSNLKSVKVNGKEAAINHQKEHIIIDKTKLVLGKNSVEVFFDAGEKSLNRSAAFLYTLLVPDRASTLFPCFDQPDIKATYNLRITAPRDWVVLAGAFEKSSIEKADFTEHTFATSDLMSTYLFSFVAGEFTEETKNPGAFDMRFYTEKITKKRLLKV